MITANLYVPFLQKKLNVYYTLTAAERSGT